MEGCAVKGLCGCTMEEKLRGQSSGSRPIWAAAVIRANTLKGDSDLGQGNNSGCGGDRERQVALKQSLDSKRNE